MIFSAVVFFAPEMGGFFLEHNNFLPADSLENAVWKSRRPGTSRAFYSVLRATTSDFVLGR